MRASEFLEAPSDLEEHGRSSKTLMGALAYIEQQRPAICILEHVFRKATVPTVTGALRGLGYVTAVFAMNSIAAGVSQPQCQLNYFELSGCQCTLRRAEAYQPDPAVFRCH